MPIYGTFSYRKRVAEGKAPDVYIYDELPRPLRLQIIDIWQRAIGPSEGGFNNSRAWNFIHDTIAREHGEFSLCKERRVDIRCESFLLNPKSVDHALDLIEVSFRYILGFEKLYPGYDRRRFGIQTSASDAIKELNERFGRADVGYRFEEGKIIRIDSGLLHSEVVKPALRYLNESGFEGPRDEFLSAHTHYRAGEMKDAITDANNAFESTLRAVCDQRGWSYEPGVPVPVLLKILRDKGLLPGYLDNSFNQLAATLHSGLPQVRNSEGGHGQGATPRETHGLCGGVRPPLGGGQHPVHRRGAQGDGLGGSR